MFIFFLYFVLDYTEAVNFDEALQEIIMSDVVFYQIGYSGGSRISAPKRNGVKSPPDRMMENGVSFCICF